MRKILIHIKIIQGAGLNMTANFAILKMLLWLQKKKKWKKYQNRSEIKR